MTPFLAIIFDTWKQSQKQIIFIIMLVALLLIAIGLIILPQQATLADGTSRVGFIWEEEPSDNLEMLWISTYSSQIMPKEDMTAYELKDDDFDNEEYFKKRQDKVKEVQDEIETKLNHYPKDKRAVEILVYWGAYAVSFISMILFLAACAGYFPGMLASGGIDIVLAKPLNRWQIYLAKYCGGLFLYAAALFATYTLIFIGLGLRTGVWLGEIYFIVPLQVFSAAVLYAMLAAIGTFSRSSILSLLSGLFFYFVVDNVLIIFFKMEKSHIFDQWPTISTVSNLIRDIVPNFSLLSESARSSVLNIPMMEWQPILTGAAWIVIMLTFGILKFNRTDY